MRGTAILVTLKGDCIGPVRGRLEVVEMSGVPAVRLVGDPGTDCVSSGVTVPVELPSPAALVLTLPPRLLGGDGTRKAGAAAGAATPRGSEVTTCEELNEDCSLSTLQLRMQRGPVEELLDAVAASENAQRAPSGPEASKLRHLAAAAAIFSDARSRPRRRASSMVSPGFTVCSDERVITCPAELGGDGHVRLMKHDSHRSKLHKLHRKRFKPVTCSHSVSQPSQIHRGCSPKGSASGLGSNSWPPGHSARSFAVDGTLYAVDGTLQPPTLLLPMAGDVVELDAVLSRAYLLTCCGSSTKAPVGSFLCDAGDESVVEQHSLTMLPGVGGTKPLRGSRGEHATGIDWCFLIGCSPTVAAGAGTAVTGTGVFFTATQSTSTATAAREAEGFIRGLLLLLWHLAATRFTAAASATCAADWAAAVSAAFFAMAASEASLFAAATSERKRSISSACCARAFSARSAAASNSARKRSESAAERCSAAPEAANSSRRDLNEAPSCSRARHLIFKSAITESLASKGSWRDVLSLIDREISEQLPSSSNSLSTTVGLVGDMSALGCGQPHRGVRVSCTAAQRANSAI